jgi:transcriptional regulator with XRE-family HTH domain
MWRLPDVSNSAIRRRLASELRRLRDQAGLSGDEVAARLGWSGSKVSRIETHRTGVKPEDLDALLDLYDVDEQRRGQLIALAGEPGRSGWWAAYSDALPEEYTDYIALEADATSIACWSPELIHGLLQTQAYATAVIRAHMGSTATIPPGELRRRIEARLKRQEILTRESPPLLTFVLDEAVLLRRFGDAAVMADQLAHLERASAMPNVTLQVLPLAGHHPVGSTGSFAILTFAAVHGAALDDVVYTEQLSGSSYVETETEAYQYQLALGRLAAQALDPAASLELIKSTATARWS